MKNILVVGGTYGIGRSLSETLINQGHQVHIWARQATPVPGAASLTSNDTRQIPLDTSALPAQLDGLVYCPGAITLKPFPRLSSSDFLSDFQQQVIGFIQTLQACLPALKQSPHASVLAFSSVAAQLGMNYHSSVAASKGALEALIRSLAAEFAPQIRFNAIAPSLTATPLSEKLLNTPEKRTALAKRHPLGRIGTPEDIAALAAFLLSDHASWISGQILAADGGLSRLQNPQ
jgi:3-oxoacyl-[acyl-carrier protein] reductase